MASRAKTSESELSLQIQRNGALEDQHHRLKDTLEMTMVTHPLNTCSHTPSQASSRYTQSTHAHTYTLYEFLSINTRTPTTKSLSTIYYFYERLPACVCIVLSDPIVDDGDAVQVHHSIVRIANTHPQGHSSKSGIASRRRVVWHVSRSIVILTSLPTAHHQSKTEP